MPVQPAHDRAALATDFSLTIDGEAAAGSSTLDVINPATGEVFARCPAAGADELDRAVAAARRAFPAWRDTSYADRAACIGRFCQALREHQDQLARPADAGAGQAAAAGEGRDRPRGQPVGGHDADLDRCRAAGGQRAAAHRAALSCRWAWPASSRRGTRRSISPPGPLTSALYTGNTVILKPSPYTPLCTLKLGELLREHFPRGVMNVLAGGDELGQWMTAHPGIDKISFTGSVATGKKVMASAAGTLKRVTLELGGNDAAIVLDDVDPQGRCAEAVLCRLRQQRPGLHGDQAHLRARDASTRRCAMRSPNEARKARVGNGLDAGDAARAHPEPHAVRTGHRHPRGQQAQRRAHPRRR